MNKTPRGYSDLGEAAYGVTGRTAVRIVQYGFLGGCLVAVQLQASKSMVTVVHEAGGSLCLAVAQVIVVFMMLPVMQLQSLGQAGKMAMIPGLVSIIVPLIIILVQLGQDGQVTGTSVGFPEESTFKKFAHGFTSIAFAFQGQQILPEIRAEMRQPAEFGKAVWGSVMVMIAAYSVVVCVGYHYLGNTAASSPMCSMAKTVKKIIK